MYEFMLEIHIAGIIVCLYMLYLLLRRKGRQSNSFVVLAIVLNIFILMGYTFELLSTDVNEMLIAIQIGYMGKCFAGVCFVTGIGKYYNWIYKKVTLPTLWGIGFLSFFIIMTAKYNKLYYTSVGMIWKDGHAFCSLGKAPYYYFFFGYLIFMFLYFAWRCLRHRKLAKTTQERNVLTVVGYGSICAVIAVIGVLFIPTHYDFGPLVFAIYSLVFLYCILRYRMFDTVDTAIYQMAIENAQIILVTREDGSVEFANKTAERSLTWLNWLDSAEIAEKVKKEFLSGKEEYRIDGRDYQIAVSQVSDGGSVLGYAVTMTDITKLKQYMADLERLSNEANEANKAKSHFLASMSHEIRTPINTMLGMNEMIVREAISENVAGYAENIREAGRSLLSIINDVLDFSKIESGKMEVIPVQYNVASVIHDIVNMVEFKAREKGLEFIIEADEKLPSRLFGDDVRLRQIILNILSNAVKYTNEGSVTFRVSGRLLENNNYLLHVEVEDTGIGIKEEDKGKIFNSFQRLEEVKNRNIEGTGLGMSITTSFLLMMGSKLELKSEYGKGSVFYFDLEQEVVDSTPVGSMKQILELQSESPIQSGCSFEAPEAKVLVVDDNRMNLEVFLGLLKHTQMQIVTAESGKEALALLKRNEFDIIFMDHMMPGMDGIETFEEAKRRWKELPDKMMTPESVPVIILTANAIYGAKEMYLQKGFTDYLSKPIDYHELEEMVVNKLPKDKVAFVERPVPSDDLSLQQENKMSLEDEKFRRLRKYGIDLEAGLRNMGGSIETYDEILTIYFEELPDKLERLRQNGNLGDMSAYSIDAHSVKSTSASIGAMELSEMAKMHEEKSLQDDSLFVRRNLRRLCMECEKMIRVGKQYLE
ncbi:MAG: response regulator [Lachnospiraceae bacterium]|nr:response regulator [Lachnospiraceae bacterium]